MSVVQSVADFRPSLSGHPFCILLCLGNQRSLGNHGTLAAISNLSSTNPLANHWLFLTFLSHSQPWSNTIYHDQTLFTIKSPSLTTGRRHPPAWSPCHHDSNIHQQWDEYWLVIPLLVNWWSFDVGDESLGRISRLMNGSILIYLCSY